MSEETEERCVNCTRKVKVYRIMKEDVIWGRHDGQEEKKGTVKLTLYDAVGPVCRKCMLEVLEYLKNQISAGKALIPRSNRTKRYKVIKGGA